MSFLLCSGDLREQQALVHAVETVVIAWSNQIRDVLSRDSSQPLLDGLNPTPYVEIDFWNAKAQNLDSICSQVDTFAFN